MPVLQHNTTPKYTTNSRELQKKTYIEPFILSSFQVPRDDEFPLHK